MTTTCVYANSSFQDCKKLNQERLQNSFYNEKIPGPSWMQQGSINLRLP